MICGGSPCQDFSVAGQQKGSRWQCKSCGHEYNPLTVHYSERNKCPICNGLEIDKTRSSLLVEWLRIIRSNKPEWAMYENVKNIVGKQFKDTFDMFISELQEYGYNTYWKVLNAKDYGVPQNRERVYVIIIKKELDNGQFKFPKPFDSGIRLKDILENEVDEKYYINNKRADTLINELIENGTLETAERERESKRETIDLTINNPKTINIANCIMARYDCGIGHRGKVGVGVVEQSGKQNR